MLDQTTRGHVFINNTFGPDAAPKVLLLLLLAVLLLLLLGCCCC